MQKAYRLKLKVTIASTIICSPASLQFIWKGGVAHEVTPRVRYNFASLAPSLNELWVKADMVIGKGVGGRLNAELAPLAFDTANFWTRLSYFVDATLYDARTLYGERNTVSFDHYGLLAASTFFGLRLRY